MKKLYTLALLALFTFVINAQTSTTQGFSSSDIKLLKGFDEQSVLNELKTKGIQESEYASIIHSMKYNFLLEKKGLKPKSTNQKRVIGNPPQVGPCINPGFEDTTFTNWTGATGSCAF